MKLSRTQSISLVACVVLDCAVLAGGVAVATMPLDPIAVLTVPATASTPAPPESPLVSPPDRAFILSAQACLPQLEEMKTSLGKFVKALEDNTVCSTWITPTLEIAGNELACLAGLPSPIDDDLVIVRQNLQVSADAHGESVRQLQSYCQSESINTMTNALQQAALGQERLQVALDHLTAYINAR